MEAFLIDDWMRRIAATATDTNVVNIQDQASLSLARNLVRSLGGASNVSSEVIDRAVLVASELGTNHLRHARNGYIAVRALVRKRKGEDGDDGTVADADAGFCRGLEVIGLDRGHGIPDIASAIDAQLRTDPKAASLGVGIGSIVRLSTEVDVDIRLEEGTFIAARLFDRSAAGISVVEKRAEVGIYGRAFEHQPPSGDHASFMRDEGDLLLFAIADGLGHGPHAREAAGTAMRIFDRSTQAGGCSSPLEATMTTIDEGLTSTRGAVVTLAKLSNTVRSSGERTLDFCAVGNIETQITSFRQCRRLRGTSGVLGQKRSSVSNPSARTLKSEQASLIIGPNEAIIFATDGVSSRCSIESDAALLGSHPIVIAQRIIESFGRDNDDALVAVIR